MPTLIRDGGTIAASSLDMTTGSISQLTIGLGLIPFPKGGGRGLDAISQFYPCVSNRMVAIIWKLS